jgi:hypothetical protein
MSDWALAHRHVRAMAADVAAQPRITNSRQTSPCTTPGAANDRRHGRMFGSGTEREVVVPEDFTAHIMIMMIMKC